MFHPTTLDIRHFTNELRIIQGANRNLAIHDAQCKNPSETAGCKYRLFSAAFGCDGQGMQLQRVTIMRDHTIDSVTVPIEREI